MMNELLWGLLLTVLPIFELRGGLPLVLDYALKNNFPISPFFVFVVLLNILVIFFVFWFLDYLHNHLMRLKLYRRGFDFYLERLRKRVDKFERRFEEFGFLALVLFVAIPLPGTGAYTGVLAAWLLGLERKKSILSISLGVLLAGILILLGSLGVLNLIR
jgi:uncharacterized membrane protein